MVIEVVETKESDGDVTFKSNWMSVYARMYTFSLVCKPYTTQMTDGGFVLVFHQCICLWLLFVYIVRIHLRVNFCTINPRHKPITAIFFSAVVKMLT